jgi:hypothetical protein
LTTCTRSTTRLFASAGPLAPRVRADLGGTLFRPKPPAPASPPDHLTAAGRALVALAAPEARPFVRRAVANLLAAVGELADYRAEYVPTTHEMSAEQAR